VERQFDAATDARAQRTDRCRRNQHAKWRHRSFNVGASVPYSRAPTSRSPRMIVRNRSSAS
jgi:hypothetical protein